MKKPVSYHIHIFLIAVLVLVAIVGACLKTDRWHITAALAGLLLLWDIADNVRKVAWKDHTGEWP